MKALNQIKWINIFILSLFVMVSFGCSDKKRRTPVDKPARNSVPGGDTQTQQQNENDLKEGKFSLGYCDFVGTMPGMLVRSDGSQRDFEQGLYDFLAGWRDPGFTDDGIGLGAVSPRCDQDTGVRMTGFVEGRGNQRLDVNGNNDFDLEFGDLLMGIYDSTMYDSSDEELQNPIPVYAELSSGYVTGNYARLLYKWKVYASNGDVITIGDIALEGNFDSVSFEGQLHFQNHDDFDPDISRPAEGKLGDFILPTCNFFNCN